MRILIFLLLAIAFHPGSISVPVKSDKKELIIFHAGSLSVPMKQIAREYEKQKSKHKDIS